MAKSYAGNVSLSLSLGLRRLNDYGQGRALEIFKANAQKWMDMAAQEAHDEQTPPTQMIKVTLTVTADIGAESSKDYGRRKDALLQALYDLDLDVKVNSEVEVTVEEEEDVVVEEDDTPKMAGKSDEYSDLADPSEADADVRRVVG